GYGQILKGIQRPTTVVFGQSSQFNRPEDLAFLQASLPQAERVTLAGGHDLPLEAPGGLAQVIRAVLAPENPSTTPSTEPRPCP
ncbi:MAG TPA: alpha/beta hydrolase, partial [Nodosilinea sp.]|nr:alpha/beta hydrolase [Nodosilinea sp.]